MAQVEKKNKGTPGRPKKKGTQYWDIGKVGRKTGITLEDKGIRDEHGLEPVSHIFSSPVSPQRHGDRTLNSSNMDVQDTDLTSLTEPSLGSAPDVDQTLHSRKTPRLPPPRASTPMHTNIGSPKRSTGRPQRLSVGVKEDGSPSQPRTQPPANRVLDFGEMGVRTSIESPSPFKPRHALRRSIGHTRPDPFAFAVDEPLKKPKHPFQAPIEEASEDAGAGAEVDLPQPVDDGPLMLDDDEDYNPLPPTTDEDDEGAYAAHSQGSSSQRKRGRSRNAGDSINSGQVQPTSPITTSNLSKKRERSRLKAEQEEGDSISSQSQINGPGPAHKKRRDKASLDKLAIHHDDVDATIDPALLSHGDDYVVDHGEPSDLAAPLPAKGKKGKKGKAPKKRDANRAMERSVELNDSPSKHGQSPSKRPGSRGISVGPVNAYQLRAATPWEDAGQRTSRIGRNLIEPLKYWANEARVYKGGETAAIVRADPVEESKPKKARKRGRKSAKSARGLGDIDEESETESCIADEWEEEMGVFSGNVANWDPETEKGVPKDLIREDLAFASSSIVTREVAGAKFKYAKIITLPFCGSGVVELPPGGYKHVKNSRKMQMCFFVHEGKVAVEVGAAGSDEPNRFAISKGGVWVVPRGNDYSIVNESRTRTARIFFSQGCELERDQ